MIKSLTLGILSLRCLLDFEIKLFDSAVWILTSEVWEESLVWTYDCQLGDYIYNHKTRWDQYDMSS